MAKRYKKKTTKRTYKASPYRSLSSPMPMSITSKLKYDSAWTLDPAAGSAAVHVFSANGLYDPDITGVGHQPRGFDQIMTMYDHYQVTGAKITVQFLGSNANTSGMICFVSTQDAAPTLTPTDYMESNKVSFNGIVQTAATTGSTRLTQKYSSKQWFNTAASSAGRLQGTTGTNPSEQVYFHVGCYPSFLATEPQSITFHANIEFIATFTERRLPNQS